MANLRDNSKNNWEGQGSIEHINAGSLQRIADATEAMAKNYVQLQAELDLYKKWYEERGKTVNQLYKRLQYKQATATRYKNIIAKLKNQQHGNT